MSDYVSKYDMMPVVSMTLHNAIMNKIMDHDGGIKEDLLLALMAQDINEGNIKITDLSCPFGLEVEVTMRIDQALDTETLKSIRYGSQKRFVYV